ncbi:MAG TPA: hypothetical protein VIQ29_05700 [Ancylobacter sp.]
MSIRRAYAALEFDTSTYRYTSADPNCAGAALLIVCRRTYHFDTQDGQIRKAAATARIGSPAATHSIARSRKSIE